MVAPLCACYALTAPLLASAVNTDTVPVEVFYETMLGQRSLLGDQGAEQALQEYYADSQNSDQNKRDLSVVAELINYFTDDVLGNYYQQWLDGYLDIPSGGVSTAVLDDSYGHYTGFYKTSSDGQPYSCSFSPSASGVIVSSSHFSLNVRWEPVAFDVVGRSFDTKPYYHWNSNGRYEIGSEYIYGERTGTSTSCQVYRIIQASGTLSSYTGRALARTISSNSSAGSGNCFVQLSVGTGLPVITANNSYVNNSYSQPLASWGSIVKLPEGILTQEPWEYFNTELLPFIKNECDNLGFDYRKITPCPNGYTPPVDPTEPVQAPTIPVATIPYNPFYEVATETHTEIVDVTDESGEVIGTEIEVQVEGVTEAEGADDYQYNFKIPELPHFKIPDVQVPTDFEIGENLANVCGGIWNTIYNFLDESGFLAVVIPALTIGLLLFILRYLGG